VKNCYLNFSGYAKDTEIVCALGDYQLLKGDFAPAVRTDILNSEHENVRSYQKYLL
jgi:hypothetical protein